MNQSELKANTCNRRQAREKRVSKSRLVWVLLLIGRESGARFFNQSRGELNKTKAKRELLSTLNWKPFYNKVPSVTNDILQPGQSYSNVYAVVPWYNEIPVITNNSDSKTENLPLYDE